MQPWILKQCESLHEVLEVQCPCTVCLVHVSRGVPKIDNSKFQVLKPLEVTSRTELEFLPVKLPKDHLPLGFLERCLQLQELLEEGKLRRSCTSHSAQRERANPSSPCGT
jgi:hypothetical protein